MADQFFTERAGFFVRSYWINQNSIHHLISKTKPCYYLPHFLAKPTTDVSLVADPDVDSP